MHQGGVVSNSSICYKIHYSSAGVAQLVERPTCNRMVEGSIPFASKFSWGCRIVAIAGDCKSPTFGFRVFESHRPHFLAKKNHFLNSLKNL